MRFGADLSFRYTQSKTESDDKSVYNIDSSTDSKTYQTGVNLVFGFNYVLNKNIVIGAELLPEFSYVSGTSFEKRSFGNNVRETNSDISGFNYGLSNSPVLLSLSYRF